VIAIIRKLQETKGLGEIFNPRRLAEKVEALGPTIDLSRLTSNIFAEIVDCLGESWDVWFGRLKLYKERHGDCRVPQRYKEDGYNLGAWVSNQRHHGLSSERRCRLDELEFIWDPFDDDWEEGLGHLKHYKERVGDCRVPKQYERDGFKLGAWVSKRRSRKSQLSSERVRRLDELGFEWDPLEVDWERGFGYLKRYKGRVGDCPVPLHHYENGFKLGAWVSKRRSRKSDLSSLRVRRLDELGFIWDPFEADWEEGFSYLKLYKEREGHCRVPQSHKENGFRLGQWVGVQRLSRETMSKDRRQRLDELGFVWDQLEADWERGFSYLKLYKESAGDCRVPRSHKESGFRLGQWVSVQRRNKTTMPKERRQRLDELGFIWTAR
jgi:hypothetical protein